MSELKRSLLVEVTPIEARYAASIMLDVCADSITEVNFDVTALVDKKPDHDYQANMLANWIVGPEIATFNVKIVDGETLPHQFDIDAIYYFSYRQLQHKALIIDERGKTSQVNPNEVDVCLYGRDIDAPPERYMASLLMLNSIADAGSNKVNTLAGLYNLSLAEM